MGRIEAALGKGAAWAHRRPWRALGVAVLLTAVGGYFASSLPLAADLEKLLPESFPSVQDLQPVKSRFGGIGYVVVVGKDGSPEELRRFADEIAPELEKLEGIRYVDFQRASQFFSERALYYLDLDDLKEVQRRIKEREKYERRQMNPMFVKLDDEEPPSLDMTDIEAKYGKRSDQRMASGGDYYLDEEKKMVVVMAKPSASASDLDFARVVVTRVSDFLMSKEPACQGSGRAACQAQLEGCGLRLSRYGKDFNVGLTGTFKYKVDQQNQLASDMAWASTVAMIVLLVYLVFHFRSVLAVGFVLVPVFAGLAWSYGITFFIFGSLNILTGFLGAILGGLGIEHGIHLLGRYEVLRSQNVDSEGAIREAFRHTGASALVSSVVAALSFLAVAYSVFRAFREFGVIAAIGMLVVVAAYVLILPALLSLVTKLGWKPSGSAAVAAAKSELARLIPRYFKPIALGTSIVLALLVSRMSGVWFDFDFHSLEDSRLCSFGLDRETNLILGYTNEPVVILTKETSSERAIVGAFKEKMRAQGDKSTIDFVAALDDLVPTEQAEKREVLDAIGVTLDKVNPDNLGEETRPKFERLVSMVKPAPFTRQDIPFSVRRQFEAVDGSKDGFVLIFPNIKLSDGVAVRDFAREVRGLKLPNGEAFRAAGDAMVLADILDMVTNEAKPVLVLAVVAVTLAMWISLGSLRLALVCLSPTVLSLLALVGLMAIIDLPFNYLNIIIVPVLIGTTVDAGVHLVSRMSEAHGNFGPVYAETGRAICGGLITSGVGFGAMLLADHPGLNSLGRLANLGLGMNLVVMVLGFPAVLLYLQRGPLARFFRVDGNEDTKGE